MITSYDMASGEIILDDPQDAPQQSEFSTHMAFARTGLQTVAEAVAEEVHLKQSPGIPVDMLNLSLAAFIAKQDLM